MTPVEKNQVYTMPIVDIGSDGAGIGKMNDFTVFVPDAVTGDTASVKILKVKKHFAFGKVVEIVDPSPLRQEHRCNVAAQCGGCQLQHMSYDAQLDWKTKKVKDALERIGGLKGIEVQPTLGMQEPWAYRNKAQYPIRMENGELKIGFFANRSHRVVASETCDIQDPRNTQILQILKAFLLDNKISIYDEERHQGLVRHVLIKTGYFSKEIMVCLVINGQSLPHQDKLIATLTQVEGIKSIVLSHNTAKTNVILGYDTTVIYGEDAIIDTIGDLKFKISPLAFFQVNPLQTKVLYDKALEYADLKGDETVWDAYCGIGTISLFLAQKAKHVYGVEIIEEAIVNARENAHLNHMDNTTFYAGKAEEVIPTLFEEEGISADTIVVDPPRKGCEEALLSTLIKMSPHKIVYVSCDPATLARDLGYLTQNGYQVEQVQPVDMFPHTTHCETCVLLVKMRVNEV
ncbi:MAG: 23S rRNA (uracil(1939)-C(5))-methyltransferase RlmD [Cellulosilyticaceae bacterium]